MTKPLLTFLLISLSSLIPAFAASTGKPVFVALDAEFGHATSTSAEAIKRGMQIAIDEINQSGGVLKGRPLELITTDNRSVPSRAIENVRELATKPDLVAVFSGKFSPVAQDLIPVIHELKLPLMAPWSAADNIIDNNQKPNYMFRLSLRDNWAISAMMKEAQSRKFRNVGMMLPNTGWGRSCQDAAEKYLAKNKSINLTGIEWYNWGEKNLEQKYRELLKKNMDTLILVANEAEGSILVKEIAALPKNEQRPILSHWGVTGGQFTTLTGEALHKIDFTVVQTYSFEGKKDAAAKRVLAALKSKYGVEEIRQIDSPVGVAHAYDLTHLLARAINKAGSTDRTAIRTALENLGEYHGLVKTLKTPFTAQRHEALAESDVFMARYGKEGNLLPVR